MNSRRSIMLLTSMLFAASQLWGCAHSTPTAVDTPQHSANATFLPDGGPTSETYPDLHNLLQITPTLFSGGEPHGEASFASLADLGIKTIVSVDGAQPDLAMAQKYGLRYVHIPIGYGGIDEMAGKSFARLAREAEGPVYVHCHHGKHRGPAAAAITCVAMGATDSTGALEILDKAGTSKNYGGLWRDVANYQVPASDVALPELVERATIDSMVAAMAKIDRAFDHLKLCSDAAWSTPTDHPDLVPLHEAVLVREGLRESGRTLSADYDAQFKDWLAAAEGLAQQVEVALQESPPGDVATPFAALKASCTQCHDVYRN